MEYLFSWEVLIPLVLITGFTIYKLSRPPPPPPKIQPIVQKKPKGKPQLEALEGTIPVRVFFGSQTGTAEDFSHKLASELKRYKFFPIVTDLEDYDSVIDLFLIFFFFLDMNFS